MYKVNRLFTKNQNPFKGKNAFTIMVMYEHKTFDGVPYGYSSCAIFDYQGKCLIDQAQNMFCEGQNGLYVAAWNLIHLLNQLPNNSSVNIVSFNEGLGEKICKHVSGLPEVVKNMFLKQDQSVTTIKVRFFACNMPDFKEGYEIIREPFLQMRYDVIKKYGPKEPQTQTICFGIKLLKDCFSDNQLHYTVYTDGSCDNMSPQKPGGLGYVVIKDGEVIQMKQDSHLGTTNNRMELLAIIKACKDLPEDAYVDVFSDSQYSIAFLVTGRGTKNRDLLDIFRNSTRHLAGIRFHWVPGHAGNQYNEMADKLAFSAYLSICKSYNIPIGNRMWKTH